MTTPAFSELVAATRHEGQAMLSAAELGLDAAVPTCGDWDLRQLLLHTARAYRRGAGIVEDRATASPPWPEEPPEGTDPVAYFSDALDAVVETLSGVEPTSPAWNWAPSADDTAAFWARRMAHESVIHRWDAQNAHGIGQRIDPDLAVDGIDELVDVMVPRVLARDEVSDLAGTLEVLATDSSKRWLLTVDADGIRVARGADGTAATTISGAAGKLLLVLYGRIPVSTVELQGDESFVAQWHEKVRI